MTEQLTGPALVAYLRDNPTSDAMQAAADELEIQSAVIKQLMEALAWSAGSLQAACKAGRLSESDLSCSDTKTRTVGEILDMADAALAQDQEQS